MSEPSDAQKRVLYKAYRAAHDGLCPKCGCPVSKVPAEFGPDSLICSKLGCSFVLTTGEIQVIAEYGKAFIGDIDSAIIALRSSL